MRDGDRGEQRKRRISLHLLLRPCVLRAEGGVVGGLDTLCTDKRSCGICPSVSSVPILKKGVRDRNIPSTFDL